MCQLHIGLKQGEGGVSWVFEMGMRWLIVENLTLFLFLKPKPYKAL